MTDLALNVLKNTFGFESFRGFQGEVIKDVINGRDVLVLMPTGGGKSLCYQVPALVMPGTAIVVSPLIALMEDQISNLKQLGIRAESLHSGIDWEEQSRIEQALFLGHLDLLYVAPERLMTEMMLHKLEHVQVSLFAIDEAHCVSQWGHDFRPEYLQLSILATRFPGVPRIALTATADTRTREEIKERLALTQARVFVDSFNRANIFYRISQKKQGKHQLLRFLEKEHGDDSGIVYCLSRKRVDDTAAWLSQHGRKALPYHGGMTAFDRKNNQQRFLKEDGVIIVATLAFGMGIDKPDVRFVAHLDLPRSIEAYYQETGRAGRDGLPATAWMVYGLQDVMLLRQIRSGSTASPEIQRIEHQKLEAMLALCEETGCRRQVLLKYFDEPLTEKCGYCDLCMEPAQTWDGTEAARKALSCVYRTGQMFGVSHLVDVLLGKGTAKVNQFGHSQLTTFGIGKDYGQSEWRSIFRQLVAKGLVNVDIEGHGVLKLNERCRDLLKGEERLLLRQDKYEYATQKAARSSSSTRQGRVIIEPRDEPLWEAMRQLRKEFAEAQGVPAYVILNDKTLFEMLRLKPTTLDGFSRINGVGEYKLEQYGEDFVQLISEFAVEPAPQ